MFDLTSDNNNNNNTRFIYLIKAAVRLNIYKLDIENKIKENGNRLCLTNNRWVMGDNEGTIVEIAGVN